MKKGIFSILAVLAVFAMLTAGCDTGSSPSKKSYTVTFDKNGGTTEASPKTIRVIEPATTVAALPAEPTKAGSIFTGWNTKADGSGAVFTARTPVTANITVYAQWEAIPEGSFVVTFDKNGGDTDAYPRTAFGGAEGVGTFPVPPTKAGYIFSAWNTSADGTGTVFTVKTPVTEAITVYAKWNQATGSSEAYLDAVTATSGNTVTATLREPISAEDWAALEAAPTGDLVGGLALTGKLNGTKFIFGVTPSEGSENVTVTYAVSATSIPTAFDKTLDDEAELNDADYVYFKVVAENGRTANYYALKVSGMTGPSTVTTISNVRIGALTAETGPAGAGSEDITNIPVISYTLSVADSQAAIFLGFTMGNSNQTIGWVKAAAIDAATAFAPIPAPASGTAITGVALPALGDGDKIYIKVVAQDGVSTRYYCFSISVGNVADIDTLSLQDTEVTN
jgi:uncharacterized repeat protein (TIGR02543 family)